MYTRAHLRDDRVAIERLAAAVTDGDVAAVPLLCESVLRHSDEEEAMLRAAPPTTEAGEDLRARTIDDHRRMRHTIAEIGEASSVDPSYLGHVSTLLELVRGHVDPYAMDPGPANGDEGASSDGDQSWARAPVTQDPSVDRSVDAVIRRTGGK